MQISCLTSAGNSCGKSAVRCSHDSPWDHLCLQLFSSAASPSAEKRFEDQRNDQSATGAIPTLILAAVALEDLGSFNSAMESSSRFASARTALAADSSSAGTSPSLAGGSELISEASSSEPAGSSPNSPAKHAPRIKNQMHSAQNEQRKKANLPRRRPRLPLPLQNDEKRSTTRADHQNAPRCASSSFIVR